MASARSTQLEGGPGGAATVAAPHSADSEQEAALERVRRPLFLTTLGGPRCELAAAAPGQQVVACRGTLYIILDGDGTIAGAVADLDTLTTER